MKLIKEVIIKRKKHKENIIFLLSFAQSKIDFNDFWNVYKNNESLHQILINDKKRRNYERKMLLRPETFHLILNVDSYKDKYELYRCVRNYFTRRKYVIDFTNKEALFYEELLKTQPKWLDLDEKFLIDNYQKFLSINSKNKRIQAAKENILNMFLYDLTPPEWLQNPEWPIANGIPLVFKKQSHDINDYTTNSIKYIFYNPSNNEEIIVEQFD